MEYRGEMQPDSSDGEPPAVDGGRPEEVEGLPAAYEELCEGVLRQLAETLWGEGWVERRTSRRMSLCKRMPRLMFAMVMHAMTIRPPNTVVHVSPACLGTDILLHSVAGCTYYLQQPRQLTALRIRDTSEHKSLEH